MVFVCGCYVFVFNGEIYNYCELCVEFECVGCVLVWCGYFDSEVLIVVIVVWGVEVMLCCVIGMFVFVLWNCVLWVLMFVCDWIGEKLFYYGWIGDVLVFVFELKVLCGYLGFDGMVDCDVLCLYLC